MATEILSVDFTGSVVAHTAATTAKGFYVVGGLVCMAMNAADADADNVFVYKADRVRVPKATGEAWTFGTKIYWDATAEKFTTTSTANTLAGIVAEAAASADTEGEIDLSPFVNAA
ncbi:DUF2190 family protein [Thioalbus denitrificans]|uniref:Uncharacterized protein DUF2190 n=1 Tax=Thioalbus denitrificans TaxID=547122 RepID=A0A369CEF5_9GAMM|nr:DUF2190 family protein [Thioalbus denitrificans]RCX32073.1 uncharacterized protein DUF2190 [Thioalbus denitrificans]